MARDRIPAPVWRRVAARVADGLTVFFALWGLAVVGGLWFMDDLSDAVSPEPWGRAFAATVIYAVLSGVYEVVFVRWDRGQTPGKDLFDVRVVSTVSGGGDAVSLRQAVLRSLLPGAARLVPPVWLGTLVPFVTACTVPFDGRRRAVHDLLAGTMVVSYDRDREEAEAAEGPADAT